MQQINAAARTTRADFMGFQFLAGVQPRITIIGEMRQRR
jgi:hypothetical protein